MKMLLIIACLEQSKLRSNYKKEKKKEKENEKTSYFKNRARHVYSILYENKYKTFLKMMTTRRRRGIIIIQDKVNETRGEWECIAQ